MTAFELATTCNSCQNGGDPCDNGTRIHDNCGCMVAAPNGDAATSSDNAYNAWTGAGCGPDVCDRLCVGSNVQWRCGAAVCVGRCTTR